MTVDITSGPCTPAESAALAEFEGAFSYPLGSGQRFRISHGPEYTAFFRALGDARLLTVKGAGGVLGSLVHVRRELTLRGGGAPRSVPAHYLCDLKVRPASRGGRVLATLMRAARRSIEASGTTACYAVVMGGSDRSPAHYTGRLGIPPFERVGELAILRVETRERVVAQAKIATFDEFERHFSALARPGWHAAAGGAALRSVLEPRPLVLADGAACGVLEDTRRAKRLLVDGQGELVSAHLSRFGWAHARAAAELVRDAAAMAATLGFPAVFVSVPAEDAREILTRLNRQRVAVADAAVHAHGFPRGPQWHVNTADI